MSIFSVILISSRCQNHDPYSWQAKEIIEILFRFHLLCPKFRVSVDDQQLTFCAVHSYTEVFII